MASPTADAVAAAADDRKGKRPMTLEEADEAAALPPAAAVQGEEEGKEKDNEKGEAAEEGEKLVLVSDDGVEVLTSVAAARMSKTLRGMIEDECATGRIPITGVHSDVLALLVEYCERHAALRPGGLRPRPLPVPALPRRAPTLLLLHQARHLRRPRRRPARPQGVRQEVPRRRQLHPLRDHHGCQLPEHRGAARRRVHHGGGQDEGEDAGGDTRHLRDRERLHTGAGGGGQEGERMGLRGLKGEEGLV